MKIHSSKNKLQKPKKLHSSLKKWGYCKIKILSFYFQCLNYILNMFVILKLYQFFFFFLCFCCCCCYYLSIYPSVHLSIQPFIINPIDTPIYILLSIHSSLTIHLFLYPYPCIHSFIHASFHLFINPSFLTNQS